MARRRGRRAVKAAAGLAMASLPVLALASPAAADTNGELIADAPYTFNWQGSEITCYMRTTTSYEWDESSNYTAMTATTTWVGFDAFVEPCASSIQRITTSLIWKNEHGDDESARTEGAFNSGSPTLLSVAEHGAVKNVRAIHSVQFRADINGQPTGSSFESYTANVK